MSETNTEVLTAEPPKAVNPFAERANQEEAKPRKSSLLSNIRRNRRRRPMLGVLVGPPGIGKSTLLSMAPNVVFSDVERGLDNLVVNRFDSIPTTLNMLREQYMALLNEEHPHETYVIDTLDAVEFLVHNQVKAEGKVRSIEDYGGGYGKGFVRSKEIFTGILNELVQLSEKMNVWLICHSQLKIVNDPTLSTGYDVYDLKLQTKAADVVQQKVDCILFGKMEINVAKDNPKAKKGRGVNTGDRLLYCQPQTGIMAKNRYEMPDSIEFSYEAIEKCLNDFWNK